MYLINICQKVLHISATLLNIIGIIILFNYGFPQPSFISDVYIAVEEETIIDKEKNTNLSEHRNKVLAEKVKYKYISWFALLLIIIGNLLNLFSWWCTENKKYEITIFYNRRFRKRFYK